ncbi:coproporphyrinogen III oxidase [Hyphomicrobium nitrativorans NL23]|uniref:Coproporphyrinogen-III oxidase n=1 Tax=Hyphomicrobium nitrativorans NL23 TaxID=1029756 RepID=V5SCT8_9HYPH|nr:oxygen-independent coproporphyrinogen III oxidase [Hyphomicrobium nitrativorans]AHB48323.1 coproporphyrinogen III oxidase [Hyphomicrobium nitrativorans NL23]
MTSDLLQRHGGPVPRYTSYPTANHFSAAVTPAHLRTWLADLPDDPALSLYAHIPYCRELCFYCGCSTKASRRYAPVEEYLVPLQAEISHVSALVPPGHRVTHIHWGGGSPDILTPADILRLGHTFRSQFAVASGAEIAVEIDPRLLSEAQADAFAEIGVNRVSIGVQDFDPKVQAAIGRIQSFETTRKASEIFRTRGVRSLNVDLVYGLPHQTVESVGRTLSDVIAIEPDRIAVFGYAHLPERLKHQRLIDEKTLPGLAERFSQSQHIAERLQDAGYVQIGIDHFARSTDALAGGAVARNFQGYTTDTADALLAFGASAISRLPQGFVQNAVAVDDYTRRISTEGLAVVRGHEMAGDDALRAYLIERLMCAFFVSWRDLKQRFGAEVARVRFEAEAAARRDADGLVAVNDEGVRVTDRGRPFVRSVCAWFDPYLSRDMTRRRHALSV